MLKMAVMFLSLFVSVNHLAISNESNAESIAQLPEKFYITADQIQLSDGKIYVRVGEFVYEVPAIYSDEKGYYFDRVAKSGHCSWYEWECQGCYFCNLRGLDWKCRACGRPISH